ncbi:MAG: hypothetical protein EOO51_00170 [Flavobacterium sp.]|nr:MAG: hypothetical protein EOO51_00170 [Flavobacterium sp.]
MQNKGISAIVDVGTIIITTVASFVVSPPQLQAGGGGIKFHNIFIFLGGVAFFIIRNWLKTSKNSNAVLVAFTVIFLIAVASYQYAYYTMSVNCYDERIVISESPIKPEKHEDWARWEKEGNYEKFVKGARCDSLKIWNYRDVVIPYFILNTLYLLIMLSVTPIVILVETKFLGDET